MRKFRRGFTLIEVALFLAVTGALFAAIAVGVQNSIFQQRFNDSVQNFTDFLRNVYAGVTNVQEKSPGGRSERAVYGKLVTFGERRDFNGCSVNGSNSDGENENCVNNNDNKNMIFVYDVVGDIGEVDTGNIKESLKALNTDVITATENEDGTVTVERNGLVDSYTPKWTAKIEETECENGESCLFTGSLLVVRHPSSGAVYTLVSDEVIQVNEGVKESKKDILNEKLEDFAIKTVDFCINPNETSGGLRADVRVKRNARNASGMEIMTDARNSCMTK